MESTARASFAKLLRVLDENEERAGEEYENLRRTLIRFFEWRGTPFPEEQTDETFDRLMMKIEAGVEIKNIRAYSFEVARLVYLEASRASENRRVDFDELRVKAHPARSDADKEKEARLDCLDNCLSNLPAENRALLLAYYGSDEGRHIKQRRELAARFGLQREALANRVQRLRDKVQYCVARCLREKPAI